MGEESLDNELTIEKALEKILKEKKSLLNDGRALMAALNAWHQSTA